MDMNKIKINNSKFTILDALKVLNLNPIGYIIFENLDLKVLGILTEGDIRRLILKKISLNVDIKKYINKNFFFIDLEKINNLKKHQLLLKKIKFLPILENSKLKQIVTNSDRIPVMQPNIRGNELKYILNCIESNWISSQGSYVLKLENKFSKFHNLKYSLATSSGTSALELAIKSLSLPKNSRIIVPNLTFAAVINAVINCGHKPIIMDVNADDWLLDIKQIKKNIPSHTKAVIFVHLYGISKDLSVFYSFCKRNKIKLIGDCAEALGGKINNKKVGTMGDISIFSFFSNKLITTGEGGMAMFKDKNNYILAKSIRDHGMDKSKRYWHTSIGNNYRLTNIQAAIGCAQMERITIFLNYRTKVNKWYKKYLSKNSYIELHPEPKTYSNTVFTYWIYTILINKFNNLKKDTILRDALLLFLKNANIETRPIFYPLSDQPIYKKFKFSSDLTKANNISYRGISLPSSYNIKESEIKRICILINQFVK